MNKVSADCKCFLKQMWTAQQPFRSYPYKTLPVLLLQRTLHQVWWRMVHEQTAVPQWECWGLEISQWSSPSVLPWGLSWWALSVLGVLWMHRVVGSAATFFQWGENHKLCFESTKPLNEIGEGLFFRPCTLRVKVFNLSNHRQKVDHPPWTVHPTCAPTGQDRAIDTALV